MTDGLLRQLLRFHPVLPQSRGDLPSREPSTLEKATEQAEIAGAKERIEREIEKVSGRGIGDDEEASVGGGEAVAGGEVKVRGGGEGGDARGAAGKQGGGWGERGEGGVGGLQVGKGVGDSGSKKGVGKWVVLLGSASVMGIGGERGVAVDFGSSRGFLWRVRKWEEGEGVLVVLDKERKGEEVGEDENRDGFYLVSSGKGEEAGGGLRVERWSKLGGGGDVSRGYHHHHHLPPHQQH